MSEVKKYILKTKKSPVTQQNLNSKKDIEPRPVHPLTFDQNMLFWNILTRNNWEYPALFVPRPPVSLLSTPRPIIKHVSRAVLSWRDSLLRWTSRTGGPHGTHISAVHDTLYLELPFSPIHIHVLLWLCSSFILLCPLISHSFHFSTLF